MANLKDLIVNGAARVIGKVYAPEFVGNLTGDVAGNADTATKVNSSLSIKDAAGNLAITSWDGDTNETLAVGGTSPITATAANGKITISHDNSTVSTGTYKSVTVDAKGHVTDGTNPDTLDGYGITDAKIADGTITLGLNAITPLTAESTLAASKVNGTLSADNIPNLDAAKITTGTISIERLPATALERCVVVANDTARFALTTSSVQVGDTVKVTDTKKMYMVIDSSKLSTEAGYEEYFTSTDWSTITDKPSSFTPSSHTHAKSQITDFPTSMPASDVYDWAKASAKPSYAWDEITSKPTEFTPASHTHAKSQITDFPTSMPASDVYDWAKASAKPSYAWGEITDRPTIPSKTSQLTNDSGFLTSIPSNVITVNGDGVVEVGQYLDFHANGSDVDYTFRFTNGADGHLDCSGGLWASGFYVSSSRKVKENINPTKVSGEDMINSVNVVDFNYIDDESKSPKVGFIAEDTDPLFSTRERKAMDSANCIGILMKAVQELSTKVKNLTSELETLTSKVKGGK